MEPWAAAVTGVVAGILYTHTADAMLRFQLDDVVNAVAIHLTPGLWGAVAVGLFAKGARIQDAYAVESFEECAAALCCMYYVKLKPNSKAEDAVLLCCVVFSISTLDNSPKKHEFCGMFPPPPPKQLV